MTNFNKELFKAATAENIAKEVLGQFEFEVEDLTEEWKEYGKKGDFRLTLKGKSIYIDIKDDKIINKTQNIFIEKEIHRLNKGIDEKGWYYANYDLLGIMSREDNVLYIVNFKLLKKKIETDTINYTEKKESTPNFV